MGRAGAPRPAEGDAVTWISVKDRLPEWDAPVLVAYQVGPEPDVDIARLLPHSGRWYRSGSFALREGDVTHWQPLPPPPERQ